MAAYPLLVAAERRLVDLTAGLTLDQLTLPTPCAGWDLRALLNHTVRTIEVFAAGADGGPSPADEDVFDGPDLLGADPAGVTAAATARSQRAWARHDGAPDYACAFGAMPATQAIAVSTFSTLTHGWDLARALGATPELPDDLLDVAEPVAAAIVPPLRELGRFGPPVEVPAGASRTARFLAFTGRRPAAG